MYYKYTYKHVLTRFLLFFFSDSTNPKTSEVPGTTRSNSPSGVKAAQTVNNAEKMQPEDVVPVHHQQQQGESLKHP